MHRALWKLYRLRMWGAARSMLRRFKSVRGAALGIFTLLVLFMMFGQNLLMLVIHGPGEVMGHGTETLRQWLPVGMLLYCVFAIGSSLGERVIYFSPSEVDFLFPGPFSRRELLLYKIAGNVSAAAFIAVIMATSLIMAISSWPAAVIGGMLAVLLVNSFTLCANLLSQIVSEKAFTRARKLLLGGILVAAAFAVGQAAERGLEGPWQETFRQMRYSPAAQVVLAPFDVYARIIAAERIFPDALGWTALGAALVIAVYTLAIRLDANYLETAVRVSRQIQERARAASREGVFANRSKRPVRTTRLPQPPWFGGAGPLAWRQTLQLLRGGRGGLVLTVILIVVVGAPFAIGIRERPQAAAVLPHIVLGGLAYVTLLLISAQFPFGFRGDYERMELLKTLPIRPFAMACGQMFTALAMVTLVQWFILAVTAVAFPASAAEMLLGALFAVPFNGILFGLEDLLFLLFPSPMIASGSEGFLKMGRVMLLMLAKFFALGVCALVAAAPAGIVYLLTRSAPAAWLVAWCVSLMPVVGILVLIAWAFQRYDVGEAAAE